MKHKIIETLLVKPMSITDIANILELNDSKSFIELTKTVNKLIEENTLFDIDGIIYITENYHIATVKNNHGYINIDGIEVSNANELGLHDGDEILYEDEKYDYKCIKVLKHKNIYVLGTMLRRRRDLYFFSDEYKFQDYKIVNLRDFKDQIKENYRVRTYISDYHSRELKIDTVLGKEGLEDVLIKTILLMNDAPNEFSNKCINEANNIDHEIKLGNRHDLRDLSFITIDGVDAKDFDDAIYVERKDNGYKLYVSIADVSNYVKIGSGIDKDAKYRGTSIYYPGHVIPMLPEVLCNDLCSLKQGVDRYCITCEMDVDFNGDVTSYEIYPSLINSKHRMTYPDVNKILEHDKQLLEEYSDITSMIYTAYELSRIVDKNRKEKGGIEFESNEPIIIEENGRVIDIKLRESGKAEVLIEDFMILANETVASHMFYLNYPLIYRNHDFPKQEKITNFINVVEEFGYSFKGNKLELKSYVLQKCLRSFEGKPEYSLVSDLLLRSMAKALYESTSHGHYGLGLEHYCHFTSPIRRYPDLMVHRMLRKYLFENDINDIDLDNSYNSEITKIANESEKRATMIERNVLDLKRCEYMKDRIGDVFDGIICSVLSFGFYVELENTVEGLVHVGSLPGYFEYDGMSLTSGETTYKVGQKIRVKLKNVDLNKRNIDFEIYSRKKASQYR